jgi:hypothetical protein
MSMVEMVSTKEYSLCSQKEKETKMKICEKNAGKCKQYNMKECRVEKSGPASRGPAITANGSNSSFKFYFLFFNNVRAINSYSNPRVGHIIRCRWNIVVL